MVVSAIRELNLELVKKTKMYQKVLALKQFLYGLLVPLFIDELWNVLGV